LFEKKAFDTAKKKIEANSNYYNYTAVNFPQKRTKGEECCFCGGLNCSCAGCKGDQQKKFAHLFEFLPLPYKEPFTPTCAPL